MLDFRNQLFLLVLLQFPFAAKDSHHENTVRLTLAYCEKLIANLTQAELKLIGPNSRKSEELSIPEISNLMLGLAGFYFILFLIGFMGNCLVLQAMYWLRNCANFSADNTFMYIIFLCLADSMVL